MIVGHLLDYNYHGVGPQICTEVEGRWTTSARSPFRVFGLPQASHQVTCAIKENTWTLPPQFTWHATFCKTRDFTQVGNAWTYINIIDVFRMSIFDLRLCKTVCFETIEWNQRRGEHDCCSTELYQHVPTKSGRVAATKQIVPPRIWSMEWASSHGQMEGVMMESGCADLRSQIQFHTHFFTYACFGYVFTHAHTYIYIYIFYIIILYIHIL